MLYRLVFTIVLGASSALFSASTNATAAIVDVMVRVENLAPANSVSFAPTRVAFHNGAFDPFNVNQTAGAAIISIAEGGSGSDWFPAVTAADPNAVSGTVVANNGPAVPAGNAGGLSNVAESTFRIDTDQHRFFTFANMVVPSNDLFLGNDAPLQLFDINGMLTLAEINQTAAQIWDANSEVADPANAAFLIGGNNDLRTLENGVVAFDFTELGEYAGLTTAAGYVFDFSQISTATPLFRISLTATAVPEPSSMALGLISLVGLGIRHVRRRSAVKAV